MTTELFGDSEELNPGELIPAIRDMPIECDFCGNKTEPEELIAQSGDQWMCEDCWDRLM